MSKVESEKFALQIFHFMDFMDFKNSFLIKKILLLLIRFREKHLYGCSDL